MELLAGLLLLSSPISAVSEIILQIKKQNKPVESSLFSRFPPY